MISDGSLEMWVGMESSTHVGKSKYGWVASLYFSQRLCAQLSLCHGSALPSPQSSIAFQPRPFADVFPSAWTCSSLPSCSAFFLLTPTHLSDTSFNSTSQEDWYASSGWARPPTMHCEGPWTFCSQHLPVLIISMFAWAFDPVPLYRLKPAYIPYTFNQFLLFLGEKTKINWHNYCSLVSHTKICLYHF